MRSQKTVIDKIFDDLPSFSWIRLPFLLKFRRKRTSQLLPNNNKMKNKKRVPKMKPYEILKKYLPEIIEYLKNF